MSHCPKTLDSAAGYSNDTLSREERRAFEAHLASCPECRAAVAFDERLRRTLESRAANVLPAPQTAWHRLATRLDTAERVPPPSTAADPAATVRPTSGKRRPRFIYFAVAAQAAAILLLAAALWNIVHKPDVQTFRTLGTEDATIVSPEPLIRVVLPSGYSPGDAGELAAGTGAELRTHFEGTEIYTFVVPVAPGESREEKLAEVLDRLRRHPDVRMAEPITDPQIADPRP